MEARLYIVTNLIINLFKDLFFLPLSLCLIVIIKIDMIIF